MERIGANVHVVVQQMHHISIYFQRRQIFAVFEDQSIQCNKNVTKIQRSAVLLLFANAGVPVSNVA